MVRRNGEREIQMADSQDKALSTRMKDELRELKKANRAKESEKKKRIKTQIEKMKMEDDISVWKAITQFKINMGEHLNSNPLTKLYNIKQISTIPDFYEYQHPKITRQKTNDKDVAWVKEYLTGGGTEKTLRETAAKSRIKVWRRISWKRKPKSTTSSAQPKIPKINTGAGGVG